MSASPRNDRIVKALREVYPDHEAPGRRPCDIEDFIYELGNAALATLYGSIFLPQLAEVDGSVILVKGEDDVEGFRNALKKTSDASAIAEMESNQNWIEVAYLFSDVRASEDAYELLGDMMVESWQARLNYLFPDKKFIVRIMDEKETGGAIGVGFDRIRDTT